MPTVPLTNELSVIPSLGKTIGVPDVIDIDPSVDDDMFDEIASVLLLWIDVCILMVKVEVESNPAVEGVSVVVFTGVFTVVDDFVGWLVAGFPLVDGFTVVVVIGLFVIGLLVVVNFCVDAGVEFVVWGAFVDSTGLLVVVEAGENLNFYYKFETIYWTVMELYRLLHIRCILRFSFFYKIVCNWQHYALAESQIIVNLIKPNNYLWLWPVE